MITAICHPKIAALPLILLMGVEGLSADWPQFRGPDGQGVSQETDLPTEWGEQQNLAAGVRGIQSHCGGWPSLCDLLQWLRNRC